MMESDFFKVERDGGVIHLIMNRPDKANAMGETFWSDLPRLVETLDADPSARAVVISGAGRHFTSGIDLAMLASVGAGLQGEPGRAAYALRKTILRLQASLSAMAQSRLPMIAAIHGACVGGGIDMITAMDIRLASEDAWFAVEEINVGMAADVGTLQRLPRIVGPGIAKELCLTGRRFSAKEAQGFALLNALHPDRDSVLAAALAMATDIASKSPLAVAGIKHAIDYAHDHSTAEGLEQIATWNAGMLRPEDLMEAMQARGAKRAAAFRDISER